MRDAQLGEESVRIAAEAIGQVRTIQALNKQQYFHKRFCQASVHLHKRSLWSAPLYVSMLMEVSDI